MEDKKESLAKVLTYRWGDTPAEYTNLILSRWIKSYRRDNDFMKMVHPPAYYGNYTRYVKNVLGRPSVVVRLAVLAESPDIVLGFSICEPAVLHYVHVPRHYRRNGIGRMLIPDDIALFTHITRMGLKLWPKFQGVKFNPFFA